MAASGSRLRRRSPTDVDARAQVRRRADQADGRWHLSAGAAGGAGGGGGGAAAGGGANSATVPTPAPGTQPAEVKQFKGAPPDKEKQPKKAPVAAAKGSRDSAARVERQGRRGPLRAPLESALGEGEGQRRGEADQQPRGVPRPRDRRLSRPRGQARRRRDEQGARGRQDGHRESEAARDCPRAGPARRSAGPARARPRARHGARRTAEAVGVDDAGAAGDLPAQL
jgi:hypothetical protein